MFRPSEAQTAVEVLDESLAGEDDYRWLGAFDGDTLAGFVCWGPTPGTEGTYDLYWLVVDPARHGRYDLLLRRFREKTGCSVIINTSFNVRGEPIVCTPQQAWRCFAGTNIDVLVQPGRSAMLRHPALHATNVLVKDHGHLSIMLSVGMARSIVEHLERAEDTEVADAGLDQPG